MSRPNIRPDSGPGAFWDLVIIFSLWQFAASQPILDLLGNSPEFFVAHDTGAAELILFTLLVTLTMPAALCGFLWLLRRLHRGSFEAMRQLLLGVLIFLIALPHTHFLEQYHRHLPVAVAVLVAVGLVALLVRNTMAREFTKYLAIAIIAVPLNFLLLSPTSRLLDRDTPMAEGGTGTTDASGNTNSLANVPVVLIVFDALPLSSLMTAEETIDGERFPAFAELASTATWYRNAITLSDSTSMAVPGVLAGTLPKQGRIPTPDDYPENLFALLNGKADLFAHESLTNLCPEALCRAGSEWPPVARFRLLVDDAFIVYLHYLLPVLVRGDLPAIGEQWQGFRAEEDTPRTQGDWRKRQIVSEGLADMHALFRKNIAYIAPRDGAAFYFQHVMAPHVPWRYVPSGKEYGIKQRAGLTAQGRWTSDDWLVTQAYQRHLLQLGAVDGLVGELLDRLRAQGMFERALVIVTADHGASFYPGGMKRAVQPENRVDLGNIPLFVKYPDQSSGRIVDGLVRSIDIAPTIAAILGLRPAERMDGADLRSLEAGALRNVQVHRLAQPAATINVEDIAPLRRRTVLRREQLFPRGGNGTSDWFYPATEFDIVGHQIAALAVQEQGDGLRADIWQRSSFRNVDLNQQLLPLRTMGRLTGLSAAESARPLAIALNGRVAAVTRSYRKREMTIYSAMLPERFLRTGNNRVAVYAIGRDAGGSITLTPLAEH